MNYDRLKLIYFFSIDEDEYMAVGISGSQTSSQMVGSDVAISYMDGLLGTTVDYNVTGKYPVRKILFYDQSSIG